MSEEVDVEERVDAEHGVRHRIARPDLWAVAAISAVAAALSAAQPVGLGPADMVWCALLGAAIPLIASRAHRSPVLWAAGVAAVVGIGGDTVAKVSAVGLLVLIGVVAVSDRRDRRVLALLGALAVQALLRGPSYGFVGLPTIVGVAALTPLMWSAYRVAHGRERRVARTVALAALVVTLVFGAAAMVAALGSRTTLEAAADEAIAGLDLVRAGDTAAAADRFTVAAQGFEKASGGLTGVLTWGGSVVPVVGQHVEALRQVSTAGEDLAISAALTASTANYRELTADEGQVDLARVIALQGPVADSSATINDALDAVADVRSPWLVAPVSDELTRFDDRLADAGEQASLAAEGLAVAPELLGANGPRRYFVAFSTPGESRGGGGYIGAYGILTAVEGKLDLIESGSLQDLDRPPPETAYAFDPPPDWSERYGRYSVQNFLGNLGASPDWPTSAGVAGQLFPQTPGGEPVDGAFYVDPAALAGLLQLTGPVTLPGRDVVLDASNVEQFLFVDQYVLIGGANPERSELLGDVAQATFDALTSQSLPGISDLTETLGPLVSAGHLRFSVIQPDAEAFLDRVGLSGRWGVAPGVDYLSIRSDDLLANKIDSFLHRDVAVSSEVDPGSGVVRSVVTVTLRNDAPAEGLPAYVIGNTSGLPPGTNQNLVSVYTPHDLQAVRIDGELAGYLTQREFGGLVHMAAIELPPGSTRTVTFELLGGVPGWPYSLVVIPQATANPDHLTVRVEGAPDGGTPPQFEGTVAGTVTVGGSP